ncbi:pstA domain protein [Mycobacterium xenopi 4042]|uniref:PstA domain protein n=1 Tax=Mycobacterium xenopi 4042 TaxID=1299334 RepID=X8CM14_MYCXE|nr:pstA domain protein [Mycobacterium xenopi 4042]
MVREAEPARAAIFEVDGQVFQRAVDYPDVELPFFDLTGSSQPEQEAQQIASLIQRTPMPFTGPLFKFALFRTRLTSSTCSPAVTTSSSTAQVFCFWVIGSLLSTLRSFPVHPFLRPPSAPCRIWSTTNWNMNPLPITWKTRHIGPGIFPRETSLFIELPTPRVSPIRINYQRRFS